MRFASLTALSIGALIAGAAQAAEIIPVEDFVRHPNYSSVKISPNGKYLAMTAERGEQDVLVVLRTKDLKPVKVNELPNETSVGPFTWVGPERLMFTGIKKFGRFARPFGTGEWYAVDADGSDARSLIYRGSRGVTERNKKADGSFSLLDPLRDEPSKVLMTKVRGRSSEEFTAEVVELDTFTGRRRMVARAPRGNCEIALDQQKNARFAVCWDSEDEFGNYDQQTELYRRGDGGDWTLLNRSVDSGAEMSVLGTSADGRIYATRVQGGGTQEFGTLDPQTGEFQQLFHDKVSDIADYIWSADGETRIGVVTAAGLPRVTLVDEEHPDSAIYASLAAAFEGQFVNFSSATRDGKQIVVSVYSDSNPGALYLYDRDSGKARFLMQGREWLDADQMASMKAFSFKNRDGMTLYGYLTIPKGSDGKNLPMIVNVHGGPMGPRDEWGFNWEAQMLANRGYLVLQVNFRGSGGFGREFEEMAFGQWRTGIMNDVIDATRWAFEQGYADPERACIYGGSFGGYAAMMAPAREPDLYRCAFGYVGAYSAEVQMEMSDTSKQDGGLRYLRRALGDTKTERQQAMPLMYADQIKLPVYLAAGARDPRCPQQNTTQMYDALVEAGNTPEGMLITSGEMHGFYKEENNLELYTEMLKFFDRHIGAKAQTVASP